MPVKSTDVGNSKAAVSLPDGLSEDVREKLLALGKESELRPAPFPIDELFIRHLCEAVEDGNPLYLDEEYARSRGLRGLMLPPVGVFPATMFPFRWPWPPKGNPAPVIGLEIRRILNVPAGIGTESEMEFFLPIQVGDRIFISDRLLSVSPWKKTRLGEGHFLTWATSYWNERREKVAEQRATTFAYGRELGAAQEVPKLKGGYSPLIEGCLDADRTGYQPPPRKKLFWEDVSVGDELPSITMPITTTRLVFMASATRDFSPQHTNPEYAKKHSKTPDVFVNTQFNMALVSRLATDWAGPTATVRRVKIKMQENVLRGDDLIVTGRVVNKYVKNGENRVDIDVMISNQERPTTPCEVSVALPGRADR